MEALPQRPYYIPRAKHAIFFCNILLAARMIAARPARAVGERVALLQLLMLWGALLKAAGIANLGVAASVAAFSNGQSMVVQQ